MSLEEIAILLICDDPELQQQVTDTLLPLMKKKIINASNMRDASIKFDNQNFDLILLGLKESSLESNMGFYLSTQKRASTNRAPTIWIVLKNAVENESILASHPQSIRFLKENWKSNDLLVFIENLYTPKQCEKNIVDVNFINPFVDAVKTVLESMAQIQLDSGAPEVRKNNHGPSSMGDISGIISISSSAFSGSMALIFKKSLALKTYENMVGDLKEQIDEEVKDAIMELTNIIFGSAKRDLNTIGHSIQPAIPSVISGENHEVRHSSEGIILKIPFKSEYGLLNVECLIASHKS